MADSMTEAIPNYQSADTDIRINGIPHTVASARIPERPPQCTSISEKELEKYADLYRFSKPNENENENEPLSATTIRKPWFTHRLPPLAHNMSWHGKRNSIDSHGTDVCHSEAEETTPNLPRRKRYILRQISSAI